MNVSTCFRTPFPSKCVHGSQTLLEPGLQRFYPKIPLIQDKVIWKICRLVRSEILGLFGNTFTADRMYCCHRWEKLQRRVQMLFSKKRRTFSEYFLAFLESTQDFAYFEKKDQLHSLNISEVIDPDKCGYLIAVSFCFRTPFASTRVHGSQTLLEPALQRFYPKFLLIQDRVTSKISPLVRSEMLGRFGNTFTADRMYSRHRWEKLRLQVQTPLSQKWSTFSGIFFFFFFIQFFFITTK